MKTYEEIKEFVKNNKQNFILGICFILVFIVGFGAGGYEKEIRRNNYKSQTNYTTQAVKKPVVENGGEGTVKGTTSPTSTLTNCMIKGNISSTGRKVYHVQGGAFYEKTKAEQCFNTEAEAVGAGFVKSSR